MLSMLLRLHPSSARWSGRLARYSLVFFIGKGLLWSALLLAPLLNRWLTAG